ncbi:MAG TPA: response regulator transcription factor [Spirochaetes bacterium]|nr:response regulator transcription factor [Spirochaetota bacterium]
MKILVAEDDKYTRDGLVEIFSQEGYETVTAGNGKEALNVFKNEKPDIVCLDIMMPLINGFDVCKEIRKSELNIPILFISAKSEEIDTVLGLELGADDYIIKPFGIKEIVARIRALTRRCYPSTNPTLPSTPFHMLNLRIVPSELKVYKDDKPIDLGPKDVKILQLLYQSKGQALDRETIFDVCWGLDYMPNTRTLDQHISQLRKKIETDPRNPVIIRTVPGVGYRYDE